MWVFNVDKFAASPKILIWRTLGGGFRVQGSG